jgi:hypothetical protein
MEQLVHYVFSWRSLRHWNEGRLLFTPSILSANPLACATLPSRMDEVVWAHSGLFSVRSCGELELVATVTARAISVRCSVSKFTTYRTLMAIA